MLVSSNNTPPPGLFFINHTTDQLRDVTFARLLTYPNVFVAGHQACFTHEALTKTADTTIASLDARASGTTAKHGLQINWLPILQSLPFQP